jgi:hypothetical protein
MGPRRESNLIKEKERGEGRGDGRHREKREREEEEENGGSGPLFMILYWLLRHLYVFLPIYLVKNPLPMDVGIVGRTTSNIVFIVVFSLPQACISSD